MNDQTTLTSEVARAFRDHGITAALTALIGGTIALFAAITRDSPTWWDTLAILGRMVGPVLALRMLLGGA